MSAWNPRPANARRAEYDRPGACIFAYRCDPADVPESQPPVSQNLGNVSEETSVVPPELSPGKPSRSVCAEAGTTMPSSGQCDCCEPEPSEDEATPATQESPNTQQSLEALYDEVDWVSLSHLPVPSSSRGRIARQVEAVRRVPFQLALATLKEQPQLVEQELREWLGSQGSKLAEQVGLVEVFAMLHLFRSNLSAVEGLRALGLDQSMVKTLAVPGIVVCCSCFLVGAAPRMSGSLGLVGVGLIGHRVLLLMVVQVQRKF